VSKRILETTKIINLCSECNYHAFMWNTETKVLSHMCLHPDTEYTLIDKKDLNKKDELTIPEWCPLPKLKGDNYV